MSATALATSGFAPSTPRPRRPGAVRRRCAQPRAVRPASRPLRLTRRGRLTVTCTAATVLAGALVAVTGAFTGASAGPERGPVPAVVTVLPGQTLSQIAAEWAPHRDWRDVAGQVVQINDLPSMTVQAGQRLVMPDRH